MCSLSLLAAQQSTSQEADEKESYAVYSAVVNWSASNPGPWPPLVIEPETIDVFGLPRPVPCGLPRPDEDQKAVYQEQLSDIQQKLYTQNSLQRKFTISRPYELRKHRPDAPDRSEVVFSFSRVGFNAARNRAVLYVDFWCGSLCGQGEFFFLQKRDGHWVYDKDFRGDSGCGFIASRPTPKSYLNSGN